ncbi:hypothetical protein F5148DRAFT_1014159 [Russula earlei]|uniref:Uncharacterized protein n=1 Tax=Russula earlei TaxID=71964 RepID=A0ACC0U8Z8_9AGAM|nr:hypothetical protein F5148DRAFT_1014159 [Russula earlei]
MPHLVPDDASLTKWQSIRPWRPRLSLSVIEITSVSATFVISSLSSNTLNHHDILDADDIPTLSTTIQPAATDSLSKGVSVNVNGTPWRKCLARLADEADEAMIIIIYGLMPGRHYDIELGIIPSDEKLKRQIVTENATDDRAVLDPDADQGIPSAGAFPLVTSNPPAVDPSPSPPSPSPPPTPSGGASLSSQTFEDHLATLQLSLSHVQAEHETLSNTLKSARRDSQRAQAAQRAETASLKRAAQKHSAGDTRMKQKARALEEAVKQAIKCREDVEVEYGVLEAARVEQEAELADASRRFEEARVRAEEWRARRKKAEEEASSRLHGARAELGAVEARLEKLRAKREKLEGRIGAETEEGEEEGGDGEGPSRRGADEDGLDGPGGLIGELEAKLRETLLERERIEADPYGQPIPSSHLDEPAIAAMAAADTRTHGHAPSHGRHASHPHSHPTVRGKRPGPPFLHHHSHSYSARAATVSFPAPASAPLVTRTPMALPSTSPRGYHPTRVSGPGAGKGLVARRKSSPPPHTQAEKSIALSLNAPPFEPVSIKGKTGSRGGA